MISVTIAYFVLRNTFPERALISKESRGRTDVTSPSTRGIMADRRGRGEFKKY